MSSLPTKAVIRLMDENGVAVGGPIECELHCQIMIGRTKGRKTWTGVQPARWPDEMDHIRIYQDKDRILVAPEGRYSVTVLPEPI